MAEWPELQEELSRKVLNVLEQKIFQCEVEKKFSPNTLKEIINSLYDAITGLVPWEVADILAAASKEIDAS